MVRLDIVDSEIKGISIDGYIPNAAYFQNKDWMTILDEKLPSSDEYRYHFKRNIFNQFLKPGKKPPKVSTRVNIYRNLIKNLRRKFCPYGGKPCSQVQYPIEGPHSIERMISFEGKKVRDVSWFPIKKEIAKSQFNENGDYIFHFAYLDLNRENYCPIFDQCTKNWMDTIGFQIKEQQDYSDFDAYKKGIQVLLQSGIDFHLSINGPFFDGYRSKNSGGEIDFF
jgi:hypothetical protein